MKLTFKLSCIMTRRRPGVSFSINSLVASGVTSRGVKPVPPTFVNIKLRRNYKKSVLRRF